jgi:hypothetical protein
LGLLALLSICCLSACHRSSYGQGEVASPANEAAIETQLRAIQSAQNSFMVNHEHYACTMAELGNQFGLLDHQLAYGHKGGYNYSIECSANVNPSYQVWATPSDTGVMSPASYCVDQTGQMHRSSHRLDNCNEGHTVE